MALNGAEWDVGTLSTARRPLPTRSIVPGGDITWVIQGVLNSLLISRAQQKSVTCIMNPQCSCISIWRFSNLRTLRTLRILENKLNDATFEITLAVTTQASFEHPVWAHTGLQWWTNTGGITVRRVLLEWRGTRFGEQQHAKAKRSHVQRAGIFSCPQWPRSKPLNLFNTPQASAQRGSSCSLQPPRALHCQIFTLVCSALRAPIPSSDTRWFLFAWFCKSEAERRATEGPPADV